MHFSYASNIYLIKNKTLVRQKESVLLKIFATLDKWDVIYTYIKEEALHDLYRELLLGRWPQKAEIGICLG